VINKAYSASTGALLHDLRRFAPKGRNPLGELVGN